LPLWYLVALIAALALFQALAGKPKAESVPLTGSATSFLSQLDRHEVRDVQISETSISWTGTGAKTYSAVLPANYDPTDLVGRLGDEVCRSRRSGRIRS